MKGILSGNLAFFWTTFSLVSLHFLPPILQWAPSNSTNTDYVLSVMTNIPLHYDEGHSIRQPCFLFAPDKLLNYDLISSVLVLTLYISLLI